MKKNQLLFILILSIIGISDSCREDFLDVKPAGGLSEYVLATEEGIDALLVGAYSMLDGVSAPQFGWRSASSNYMKQARALRGWYHFEAWRMWKMIPYVDENTDIRNVSNKEDIRTKIIDDLQEGALPLLQDARGGTKPDGSPIGLAPTYGEVLNFPYKPGGSPGGCCGFYQPTQEFVNSYRTSGGLPLLDFSYNNDPVISDQGLAIYDPFVEDAGPLDPRLDWAVGRRGIPYWDWGVHTGSDWIRDQTYAGPYSPKKQVYKKTDEGIYTEVGNWTSGWTANGYRMIRYADLLLLLAECQIETGDLTGALANINMVRERAANPNGYVMESDGTTPAATYDVKPYPSFPDQTYARNALRMERKLELGMEGHRWFDLNRWGITVTELNRALAYEKTMPWGGAMYGNATVGAEDVTYPIPQRQIDMSYGKLVQNR
ncbi:MAG TPA: RagB/SusD family nutrient uptake outer membrane protein [Bacteroidales bacterium]|nr:RagB/SusD family nutrient uptake outer membrane protein [Bacteroidales bacterium]